MSSSASRDRRVAAPRLRLASPVATLILTNECRHSCRHCLNDSGAGLTGEMGSAQVVEAFHAIKDALGVSVLILSGGEPLLKKGFAGIFTEARSLFEVCLFSTGLGLSRSLQTLFTEAPPKELRTSLYGSRQTHEAFCGRPGAFSISSRAMEFFARAGSSVAVNVVVHRENVDEIAELIDHLLSLGFVEDVRLVPFWPIGRGKDILSLILDPEEWTRLEDRLRDRYASRDGQGDRAIRVPMHVRRSGTGETSLPVCSVVNGPEDHMASALHVDADGEIYACPMLVRNPVARLGNILRIQEVDLESYRRGVREEHARIAARHASRGDGTGRRSGGCFASQLSVGADHRSDSGGFDLGCLTAARVLALV